MGVPFDTGVGILTSETKKNTIRIQGLKMKEPIFLKIMLISVEN